MTDNNTEFDDLFQDFFEKKINNSEQKPTDTAKAIPAPKAPEKENVDTLIDSLLSKNKSIAATNPENKTVNIEAKPAQAPEIKTPSHKTPQKQNNPSVNPIAEEEASNIEGGSSEMVMNPEVFMPRSREVDEILSFVPSWMIRWGITTIFVILMGIIAMSYFIKYPDIVTGQVTISSAAPPASVIAKANGSLLLFKEDKEALAEGEVIALIKNDAEYDDILSLKESLKAFQNKIDKDEKLTYFEFPKDLDLGSLQGTFADLEFRLKDKRVQASSRNNDSRRKSNINNQIREINNIQKEQTRQITLLKEEYLKAKKVYENRYQALYKNGSISAEQLEAKESEVTRKLNAYQSARSNLNENKNRILDLEARKNELDYNSSQTESTGLNSISMAYSQLINDINTWENQFLLTAPIAGRLNYLQFVKDNVHAKASQELASIVPITDEDITKSTVGELFVPAAGIGKIDIGQDVNIELDAYLKKEYGVIIGQVSEIADVATTLTSEIGIQTAYKVVVNFEEGLETTTGKDIVFKHNMKGKAEVITKDVRLIERIFNELRETVDAE